MVRPTQIQSEGKCFLSKGMSILSPSSCIRNFNSTARMKKLERHTVAAIVAPPVGLHCKWAPVIFCQEMRWPLLSTVLSVRMQHSCCKFTFLLAFGIVLLTTLSSTHKAMLLSLTLTTQIFRGKVIFHRANHHPCGDDSGRTLKSFSTKFSLPIIYSSSYTLKIGIQSFPFLSSLS